MAWIYLAESEDLQKHSKDMSNLLPIVKESDGHKHVSYQECLRETSQLLRYGTMLRLCEEPCSHPLKSYTEASHAKTLPSPIQMEKVWMESEPDYFSRSVGLLASYDQDSFFLRTFQQLLFEGQNELLQSCAGYGMTVDGALYELAPWGQITTEIDGSYLPTPMASDGEAWTKVKKTDVQKSIAKTLIKSMDRLTYRFQWLSLSLRHVAEYVEWMMGYQKGWTALEDWAMQWFQSKQEKLLKC